MNTVQIDFVAKQLAEVEKAIELMDCQTTAERMYRKIAIDKIRESAENIAVIRNISSGEKRAKPKTTWFKQQRKSKRE